jgi:demethylspheroidene O-methyltransferase
MPPPEITAAHARPPQPNTLAVPDAKAPAVSPPSWSDRWFAWRNRLLASRVFQRRAAAWALTRPIARRRARALFDLVAGFVYSQVLLACVRLKLFDLLADRPQTLVELAPRVNLGMDALQRLVVAATSLQLLEARPHGRYGLGVLGATMVGNTAVAAMVEHHAALYADLADPVALLRGTSGQRQLAAYWPYANTSAPDSLTDDRVACYSTLMSASQPLVAQEILDTYSLSHHRCLLDVGGGEGTFLMQAARAAPQLQLSLFDLPAVAERAADRLASAGLAHRAQTAGGDFFNDPLPTGADIVSLVRVIHDHDDARVLTLLKAIHTALAPGGTVLIAEPMAGTPGAEAMGDAYFGFYLWAMGRGQARTPAQLTSMLEAVGFQQIRRLNNPMPLQTQILVARKGLSSSLHHLGVNLD